MPRLLLATVFLFACAHCAGAQEKTDPKDKKVETDPKSNIKDKIFGKWKIVDAPGLDKEQIKQLEMLKLYVFMEFKADGSLAIGAAGVDAEAQKLLDNAPKDTTVRLKYRLLADDEVEFFDLPKELQKGAGAGGLFGKGKDKAKTTMKIDKDAMTMTDEDGKTGKLTRVKDAKDKDKPEKK